MRANVKRAATVVAVGAVALAGAVWGGLAAFAAPDRVPLALTIANESGSGDPVYVTALGHLNDAGGDAGPEGYLDGSGGFHAFPAATSSTPVAYPAASFEGPANGGTTTLRVPSGFSGRIYYSLRAPVQARLVLDAKGRTGVAQPAPWAPGQSGSGAGIAHDWIEISYDVTWGLFVNSTQVDIVGVPAAVTVTSTDGTTRTAGDLTRSVDELAAEVGAVPGFEGTVQHVDGVTRLLNPAKAVDEGLMDPSYLAPYVDAVWAKYRGETLTVRPFQQEPAKAFVGRVVGESFVFRDTAGTVVAQVAKPTTQDVFRCDGALRSPNDATLGPITRSLCADLNRGVLGTVAVSPSWDASTFYRDSAINGGRYNHFAQIVHAAMSDGRAYAFSFDDVAQQESLVSSGAPASLSIVILPLAGGGLAAAGSAPAPAPSPTTAAPTPAASPTSTPSPSAAATPEVPAGTPSAEPTVAPSAQPSPAATGTPCPSPSPSPSPSPTADPGPAGPDAVPARTFTVDLDAATDGYAWFDLGPGTTAGELTIVIDGDRKSTISVDGPGRSRADFFAHPGAHAVTVTSTGLLGSVSVEPSVWPHPGPPPW